MSGKRGKGYEGDKDDEEMIEATAADLWTVSSSVSTAPPSWIIKLRKPELRAELDDRSVKFEKMDNKSVLVELLRLRLGCEVLLSGNNFLNTNDFRRLLIQFVPDSMLMTMRVISKPWLLVANGIIDEGVLSGDLMVLDETSIGWERAEYVKENRVATRVIFLLNITKVGENICSYAVNLVAVDIPGGVERIGKGAFCDCENLTTVYFPGTLKFIGMYAFANCAILDNVDLLHTNLQELGHRCFDTCSELKSMTIPDSLQTISSFVFANSHLLLRESHNLANNINDDDSDVDWDDEYDEIDDEDKTVEVIAYLRSKQEV
ncbi:hypothetical protein TL16_g04352 [Triparma laevis f. inornata]|uniref:Uncharacterized protein n=1 Tax=Triparma laevis f. inornata TaxID=1714386 RepID=A0A9W7E2W3_9STRA|nr:hypothetical protein TL16_g04352 [Triparma laevis f. inornata]